MPTSGRRSQLARPLTALLVVVAVSLAIAAGASAAATTETENIRSEVAFPVFAQCANDGAGEWVDLTARLHMVLHRTTDAAGTFHSIDLVDETLRGVGRTTGTVYNGRDSVHLAFNFHGGISETFVMNIRLLGQGAGNDFLLHETFHFTITPNGDMTAVAENLWSECR